MDVVTEVGRGGDGSAADEYTESSALISRAFVPPCIRHWPDCLSRTRRPACAGPEP